MAVSLCHLSNRFEAWHGVQCIVGPRSGKMCVPNVCDSKGLLDEPRKQNFLAQLTPFLLEDYLGFRTFPIGSWYLRPIKRTLTQTVFFPLIIHRTSFLLIFFSSFDQNVDGILCISASCAISFFWGSIYTTDPPKTMRGNSSTSREEFGSFCRI